MFILVNQEQDSEEGSRDQQSLISVTMITYVRINILKCYYARSEVIFPRDYHMIM